jgi:hypothetical protein
MPCGNGPSVHGEYIQLLSDPKKPFRVLLKGNRSLTEWRLQSFHSIDLNCRWWQKVTIFNLSLEIA